MAKLIVIYDQPKNKEGFEEHYFNVHTPLAQKLPNLKNFEAHRVVQSSNTSDVLYLFAELEFENVETLNQSLSSSEGRELQSDVRNLLPYLNKPPVISIVD
jgi:uncharacterized protein (TIGR02118 family)